MFLVALPSWFLLKYLNSSTFTSTYWANWVHVSEYKDIWEALAKNKVISASVNTMLYLLYYIMSYNRIRFRTLLLIISRKFMIQNLNLTVDQFKQDRASKF